MRSGRWPGRNEAGASGPSQKALRVNERKAKVEWSGFVRWMMRGSENDVENDEDGADGDGGVGNVKGGPAVGTEPDFEEVGDATVEDAVGDVAGGTAKK